MRQFSLRAPIGPAKVLTAYSPPPVILSDLWSLVLFYCLRFFLSRPPFSHKEGLFHRNPKSGMHSRNSWTLSIILTGRVFGRGSMTTLPCSIPEPFPSAPADAKNLKRRSRSCSSRSGGAKTSAPYMDIQPKDMKIQIFGDIAIATFHLELIRYAPDNATMFKRK